MLAGLTAIRGLPRCTSTVASTQMETMFESAEGNALFQLYFSGDGSIALKLVERATSAGYETLILIVDLLEVGRRPCALRHDFKMPFRIGVCQFIDVALHPRWLLVTLFAGLPRLADLDGKDYFLDCAERRGAVDWSCFARLPDA